jgi:hypothetical protein
MADPVKAVKDIDTEVDKACQEYDKVLEAFKTDLRKTVKKFSPKNKKAAAQTLDKLAVLIGKVRMRILSDKQALAQTQFKLEGLTDHEDVKKSRDRLYQVGVAVEKVGNLYRSLIGFVD